ncbi:MAG: hypothetical protein U0841_27950 [Chloroflexia bacterium]
MDIGSGFDGDNRQRYLRIALIAGVAFVVLLLILIVVAIVRSRGGSGDATATPAAHPGADGLADCRLGRAFVASPDGRRLRAAVRWAVGGGERASLRVGAALGQRVRQGLRRREHRR